jgi:hypothetical protein
MKSPNNIYIVQKHLIKHYKIFVTQFFKGVTIVFGGDFRQILPIIPRDARPQIIGACLCRSPIWQHVTLSINMRLQNESLENREFA